MGSTSSALIVIGLVVALVLTACSGDDADLGGDGADVHRLVIDLQDGFDGIDVEILVNGRSVARLDGVETDEMLGVAESVEVEVPSGATELVVRIGPEFEAAAALQVDADRFVGVSRAGDELSFAVATDPFGYG